MARKFNPDEVTFSLTAEPEDLPLEGAFDLGSDELNEETTNAISERLERGDVWAWASVKVTASWAGFEGDAYIGGCNYEDEDDFRTNSGYFKDLLKEAANALVSEIEDAGWEIEVTEEDITKAVAREIGAEEAA